MPSPSPMLHLFCGKIASGKSTLAAELGRGEGVVVIAEDIWLGALFGEEMATVRDYGRCSAKLRRVMGPHVAGLLRAGLSVVLDFPANTRETRAWMREILEDAAPGQGAGPGSEVGHRLHVLDVPDAVCLARLQARNAQGDHPFAATEAQFHQITQYYQPPDPEEGFVLVRHEPASE